MLHLQGNSATYYAAWVLIGLFSMGTCIVLFTLLRRSGRGAEPVPWALLAIGVGVVPLLSGPIGMAISVNHSETVEFCASCHRPMQSYVDDMKDPRSESLAAVHYKNRYILDNQCYVCHTASGILGTVHAKTEGIIDLYKYYAGTFRTPIVMRRAYANTFCLKCHGDSAKFNAIKDHYQNQAALFSGKRPCMDCHAEAAPAHAAVSEVTSKGQSEVKNETQF
jgi:nitrate/TMAO reductase-like tetraheme cytochrome c subunit